MGRTRRVLSHGWRTIALVGTFVSSSVVGLSLHANMPVVRRLAAQITNSALTGVFEGRLVIENVESLSIGPRSRVRVEHVVVTDPEGRAVVVAHGVEADIRLDELLGSIAFGAAPRVTIGDAQIDGAEVVLDVDAEGTLGIVRAFHPAPKAEPDRIALPSLPLERKEDVTLHIDRALVRHAWVHGNLVPPALDGDADDVRARIAIERDIFTVELGGGRTTLRSPRIPGQQGDVRGDATGRMTIPLEAAEPSATRQLTAHADLRGDLGGIPFVAQASIAKDDVDASLDVERAEPDAIAKAFPSVRVSEPIELHATAKGKLPSIGIRANVRAGAAEVKADGEIDVREGNAFRVDLDATHVDGALVRGPSSDLSGLVHVEGNLSHAPSATFRASVDEGTFDGQAVPPLTAEGRFEDGKATATFRASEPGIDASGKLVLDVARDDLAFDVQARSSDLSKLERAPGIATGSGSVRARGNLDLAHGTIHAHATAEGEALSGGPVSAARAHAKAAIFGPTSAPTLLVTASGDNVALRVPGKEPLTYPRASGSARVTLVPRPRITDAELHVSQPGAVETVSARAELIEVMPGGGVVIRGSRVTGLGGPLEAEVDLSGPNWKIRAKGDDVDVERAAAITGISQLRHLPEGTRASVDIDVSSDASGSHGHADVAVKSPSGVGAEAHLAFGGRRISGTARAAVPGLGFVEASRAEIELPGPLGPRSIEEATGSIDVRGELDLSQVGGAITGEDIEAVSGIAVLSGRIERGAPKGVPSLRVTARTRGLEVTLAGKSEPDEEGIATSRVIRGLEAGAHVAYDGLTDDSEIALLAWDRRGVLASADAKARMPLAELARGDAANAWKTIVHAPLAGIVDIPVRRFAHAPTFITSYGLAGSVQARGELEGSLDAPRVVFNARTIGFRQKDTDETRTRYEPIDGVVEGRWDGEHLVALVSADERDRAPGRAGRRTPRGRPVRDRASARVRGMILGSVRAQDLLAAPAGKAAPWSASAEIDVQDLELSELPLPKRLRGVLTGRLKLRDVGSAPSIEAKAHVSRFALSGARVESLDLAIGGRDGTLYASARAIEKGKTALDVTLASRAFRWRGVEPSWDASELTRVDYFASGLRLSLLRPFARDAISDLDGRLDGRGSAMFDAASQTFEGGIALSEGRLYIRSIGEEITDMKAHARFERSGIFRINDATGKAGEGVFRAAATGRMKGLSFTAANATLIVPSKNGIPLSSEGVEFAEATGEVRLQARMSPDRKKLLVTVDVPRANIELPRRDTPDLEPLEPDPAIEVGIRRAGGRLEPVAIEGRRVTAKGAEEEITTQLTVVLGEDVILEGKGLRIQLTGKTLVEIADELEVTGRIDLRGGTIEAHGRRFTLDRGSVTFPADGDPGNPTVVAAAYWDAPDRTRIWVEFAGPLKTGELTLRSEPAYSKNEILSILLFGRPDPNMATPGGRTSDTGRATAIGSGFVATDINRALAELDENLQVETDTLSGNRTRTKLGYKLTRDLQFKVGYAPGQTTYREPDTTFAFLDWQFVPKWSLLATQGNRGTSILDVLFQHRY